MPATNEATTTQATTTEATIAMIAAGHLRIESLAAVGRDSADFRECHVTELKAALEAAFAAGHAAGRAALGEFAAGFAAGAAAGRTATLAEVRDFVERAA